MERLEKAIGTGWHLCGCQDSLSAGEAEMELSQWEEPSGHRLEGWEHLPRALGRVSGLASVAGVGGGMGCCCDG